MAGAEVIKINGNEIFLVNSTLYTYSLVVCGISLLFNLRQEYSPRACPRGIVMSRVELKSYSTRG